jgi:hypothetical protein
MAKRKIIIYRSAITGQIVSEDYAVRNPATTEREVRWVEE